MGDKQHFSALSVYAHVVTFVLGSSETSGIKPFSETKVVLFNGQ